MTAGARPDGTWTVRPTEEILSDVAKIHDTPERNLSRKKAAYREASQVLGAALTQIALREQDYVGEIQSHLGQPARADQRLSQLGSETVGSPITCFIEGAYMAHRPGVDRFEPVVRVVDDADQSSVLWYEDYVWEFPSDKSE